MDMYKKNYIFVYKKKIKFILDYFEFNILQKRKKIIFDNEDENGKHITIQINKYGNVYTCIYDGEYTNEIKFLG